MSRLLYIKGFKMLHTMYILVDSNIKQRRNILLHEQLAQKRQDTKSLDFNENIAVYEQKTACD